MKTSQETYNDYVKSQYVEDNFSVPKMITLSKDRVIDPQHVESLTWGRVRNERDELIIRMVSGHEISVSVKGNDAAKVYDLIMQAKQGSRS